MRVIVDYELCESNGICADLVPEVYELGEDDMHLMQEYPSEELRASLQQTVRRCPRQAIRLED